MFLNKITLKRDQLISMNESERNIIVVGGYIHNELSMLQKWIRVAAEEKGSESFGMRSQTCQTMFISRMLAAKTFEGWQFLGREYFGSSVSKYYDNILDAKSLERKRRLKRYFGSANVVAYIRNDYSNHFSSKEIYNTLYYMGDDDLPFFAGEDIRNMFFQLSEMIVSMTIFRRASQLQKTFDSERVATEIIDVSDDVLFFINTIVGQILYQHKIKTDFSGRMEVDVEHYKKVSLPFFIDVLE